MPSTYNKGQEEIKGLDNRELSTKKQQLREPHISDKIGDLTTRGRLVHQEEFSLNPEQLNQALSWLSREH